MTWCLLLVVFLYNATDGELVLPRLMVTHTHEAKERKREAHAHDVMGRRATAAGSMHMRATGPSGRTQACSTSIGRAAAAGWFVSGGGMVCV
jgi:hypothetical protein